MKSYQDDDLKFSYPSDWIVDKDLNTIAVYNPTKGVGVLQFSTYNIPNPKNKTIKEILRDYVEEHHDNVIVFDRKSYVVTNYVNGKNKRCWKYYLCIKDTTGIFATYNCSKQKTGIEDKIVDQIIKSAFDYPKATPDVKT